jgi:hypothetical protein
LTFEPSVPGDYTVFAAFEGSKSYYGSQGVTAINVEEAPAVSASPMPLQESVADTYFLPVSIGMLALIVVVLALLVLLLFRKR